MPDFWKNKKILAYIALAHHTRFITPVMEKMASRGAVIRYIVGQGEKSQEITAINLGLEYRHVFDYVTEKDTAAIQENYRLLRDAFIHGLKNSFLFNTSPVTVIDKTIYATAMEYVGFKNLIKKEKPDLCVALHELNRWGKMFAFWAKKQHVPVITFQEGLYFGLNFGYTGHVQNSTLNLVWGKRLKKRLTDFEAPADRIVPVGNTHLSRELANQKKNQVREKKRKQYDCTDGFVVLLLFSGQIPQIQELHPLFDAVAASENKHLFIKFHPTARYTQVQKWISLIPDHCRPCIRTFFEDENIYDLISASDICTLVQNSTTGLEALFFGKPLVILDENVHGRMPSSFEEFKVAVKMTPETFGTALKENHSFTRLIDQKHVQQYLEDELSGTLHAINTVQGISEKLIRAAGTTLRPPLRPMTKPDKDWSVILPVCKNPAHFLKQLEAIAVHSENSGTFEVILIEPDPLSPDLSEILNSLTGDVTRIPMEESKSLPGMMNLSAQTAKGNTLVFMTDSLIPLPGWLHHLDRGIKNHKKTTLMGARILTPGNSIHHAGLLIDNNHAPVSAYKHVAADFPNALKERPFMLLDHFISINHAFFHKIGGFWEKAGKFLFMDICLQADTFNTSKNSCMYLPDVCLIAMDTKDDMFYPDDSIWFYGKWHGHLWENQAVFYAENQIGKTDLDAAMLAQSMASATILE
jgi:hypothetical protein